MFFLAKDIKKPDLKYFYFVTGFRAVILFSMYFVRTETGKEFEIDIGKNETGYPKRRLCIVRKKSVRLSFAKL